MDRVEFRCDLSRRGEALPHCWEHTVGSCHAPLALRERIDEDHANPKRLWDDRDQPEYLHARDILRLHEASTLRRESVRWKRSERAIALDLELPAMAVASVTFEFGRAV